ncbi:MAG: 2-amino-4-hydroxy-6-hydroxymethyldihydropteridine diphosphokinase [Betaproteobacteria bacterium]|nr:2-amino-4-hydroxy-6-hydroxymethyldihydropteridine diphosphokinase [Betaproteobacteria bacterium]
MASLASVAYVALGANLGDPLATIAAAMTALTDIPATRLAATSSLYRTAPVGLKNQPDFINAVVALETSIAPHDLLAALFAIEAHFGRSRSVPNAPRTLDLDLLLYGESILADAQLTLPHPRMHSRAFVLAPLLEIAPDCRIPGLGAARTLLDDCRDQRIERLARVVGSGYAA